MKGAIDRLIDDADEELEGEVKRMLEKNLDKNERKLLFQKALDLRDGGAHAHAMEILRCLLLEDPSDIDVLFILGGILFNMDEHREAADVFRRVLEQRPENEPASLALFHSLWKLGYRREAYQEMRRFLEIADSREYERLLEDIDEAFRSVEEETGEDKE
jgi:tetratricopeptide (TPR) repeat protein